MKHVVPSHLGVRTVVTVLEVSVASKEEVARPMIEPTESGSSRFESRQGGLCRLAWEVV